jgi:thiamine biosynthesis protein ThiI
MNKEEIVQLAKQVDTYKYSIMQYPDCCSYMIAKHPETRSKFEDIKKMESLIKNIERLVEDSVSKAEVKRIE